MRRRTFGRRRRGRAWMLALLLFLTTLLLVSCVAGSNALWVRGILGLDIDDYVAEPTLHDVDPSSAVARQLLETVSVVLDDRTHLTPFAGTAEAVEVYRDEILGYLLRTNYTQYVGNRELIQAAENAYPHTVYSTLVPASDFENTVFCHFGGTSVSHTGGESFTYLSRAALYTSPISARATRATVDLISLEETQNTYRMTFTVSVGEEISEETYRAVFVKRADGSAYWKVLEVVG